MANAWHHCIPQRTEVYEYAMSLGNSQYSLPSLQPYKLVYAAWLADVGRIREAFRCVQRSCQWTSRIHISDSLLSLTITMSAIARL